VARLRDRERRLTRAARQLEDAWAGRDFPVVAVRGPLGVPPARPRSQAAMWFVLGAAVLGIGLLLGWLIWG
jgi:hypothetical protein